MGISARNHEKRTPEDEHKWYMLNAIKAAEGLGYPEEIIARIKKCKTDSEISHIMTNARNENLIGHSWKHK